MKLYLKVLSKGLPLSKCIGNESCLIISAVVLQMQHAQQPATTWAQLFTIPGGQNLPLPWQKTRTNNSKQTIYFLRINIFSSFEINTNQFERWGESMGRREVGTGPNLFSTK